MTTSLLNLIKAAVAPVNQAVQQAQAQSQAAFKDAALSVRPTGTVTTNLNVTTTNIGDLKVESTAVTYGQTYQIQQYNSDGQLVLKTIPLSELVSAKFTSSAPQSSADLNQSEAQLIGSVYKSAQDVQAVIQAGLKIDLNMAVLSKESTPLEFNMLQTPELKVQTHYNFYEPTESRIDVQEDPTKDPFSSPTDDAKVPCFVKLTWNTVDTLVESKDFAGKTREEEALVQQFLKPARGVANGSAADQSKVQALLRNTNALSANGITLELVDTHDLPTAFKSISNSSIFKDSILATLNTVTTDASTVDFNDILFSELEDDGS